MAQLVNSVPTPTQEYKKCLSCDKLFTLENGFDSGKYSLCSECEKKIDKLTKPDVQITIYDDRKNSLLPPPAAAFKIWLCKIVLSKSYRLITDMNHEYMHFILQKEYGVRVSAMWDNVSEYGELDGVYENFSMSSAKSAGPKKEGSHR